MTFFFLLFSEIGCFGLIYKPDDIMYRRERTSPLLSSPKQNPAMNQRTRDLVTVTHVVVALWRFGVYPAWRAPVYTARDDGG